MASVETPRSSSALPWATLGVIVFVAVMGGLFIPGIGADTGAVRRLENITACQQHHRTDVDQATLVLFTTYGNVQSGLAEGVSGLADGVIAAIGQDQFTLVQVAQRLAEMEQGLAKAEMAKVEAVVGLSAAAAQYQTLIDLSVSDPDAFLDTCAEILP